MKRILIIGLLIMLLAVAGLIGLAAWQDGPLPGPGASLSFPAGDRGNPLRLATVVPPGGGAPELVAALEGGPRPRLLPLARAHKALIGHPAPELTGLERFIHNWSANLTLTRQLLDRARTVAVEVWPSDQVKFLPPLPRPVKLVDCSLFFGHNRNSTRAFYRKLAPAPLYTLAVSPLNLLLGDGLFSPAGGKKAVFNHFVENNLNLYGSGARVMLPRGFDEIDIETELALLIIKDGRDIPPQKAEDYIGGLMLYNDFSQRDIQARELCGNFGFVKSKAVSALGPWLVVGLDPAKAVVDVLVNGHRVSRCAMGDQMFSLARAVSFVSDRGEGLAAGEVIGLGTLSGGSLFETGRPMLKKGDVVELKGSHGLGQLISTLVEWRAPRRSYRYYLYLSLKL